MSSNSLMVITLLSHITVLGISGELFLNSITMILLFISFLVIFNPNIELFIRILISFIITAILFYSAYLYDFLTLAVCSIILMSILNLVSYEYCYRLLVSYVHSLQLSIFGVLPKDIRSRKILFWQTKLTIIQLALEHNVENKRFNYDYYGTWIKDLLGTNDTYGIEIRCHNDFKFSFVLKSPSEKLAIRKGQTLKAQLQTQYRGLDVDIEIKPITRNELYDVKHNNFYEIKLPKPPFLDKIKVIQSFISAFKTTAEDINLYVVWKKVYRKRMVKIKEEAEILEYRDEEERSQLSRLWQDDLFRVRIFVSFKLNHIEKARKNMIEGIIDNIAIAGRNEKKPAKLKKVRKGVIVDFYKSNFFSGQFLTSYLLDFDLAKELPVQKRFIYETQSFNLRRIPKGDSSEIIIGNHLLDGVISEKKAIIPIKSLRSSLLLVGKPEMGKTYLIANILRHIKKHSPKIGVLIINLAKGAQKKLYPSDYCLKWGDKRLQVPYAVFNDNFQRCLNEISECLVYSVGLKNVVVNALNNTLTTFYTNKLRVPDHINHLFSELLRYLEKNPYDARLQMRIVQAIKHRFTTLFTNSDIISGLRVRDKIPLWVKDVLFNGKKVMLDLSGCSAPEKRLLSTLILQMFRTLIPDREEENLKRIIVLDEAHQLTSKPENVNPDDDDFIAMDSFRKIFSVFIREFRSKGTCLFLADQTAEGLYDSAINIPCLFFLFNQSLKSAQHFTNDLKEQELISRLDERICMLKRGSDSYLFRTEDYRIENIPKRELSFKDFFQENRDQLPNKLRGDIE
ncbi:MAG: hypothetical protein KJI71_00470 [Patescibacteria group bacterium]|nr:hypothetical protein [Patescibacteria group bacterium]